jgi:hypothetical protein
MHVSLPRAADTLQASHRCNGSEALKFWGGGARLGSRSARQVGHQPCKRPATACTGLSRWDGLTH